MARGPGADCLDLNRGAVMLEQYQIKAAVEILV
jgi:hypothetical protein